MVRLLIRVCLAAAVFAATPCAAGELRFAVTDFEQATTDPQFASLGKGLQSMLATDLAQVTGLTVVERQRLRDICEELELAASGSIDPETAARMGKLAGATHLVSGSYTVVGGTMRLDARLFVVESGAVVLATDVEGEKDAFFELQKELVKQLIEAVDIRLTPKERASVGRVHTADFEAFQEFSDAVSAFDAERYDEALATLQQAAARDEDFKLARMTLAEYESLIDEIRTRSEVLQVTRAELARLELQGAAGEEAQLAARLMEIAARDGDEHQQERLTALMLLAVSYGDVGYAKARYRSMREIEDEFAMERAADRFAQRYWFEARPLWPAVPPMVHGDLVGAVRSIDSFDEDFAAAVTHVFNDGKGVQDRDLDVIDQFPKGMAPRLHLDRAETATQYLALMRDWKDLDPDHALHHSHFSTAASMLTNSLLLDESTAVRRMLSAGTDDEIQLKILANDIETNRDLSILLDGAEAGSPMAEYLMAARGNASSKPAPRADGKHEMAVAQLDDEALWRIGHYRILPRNRGYVLLGDRPVWLLTGYQTLGTGPRSDPNRTGSLRFYRNAKPGSALTLIDGVPRDHYAVEFELDYRPADDWWPRDVDPRTRSYDGTLEIDESRPSVGFLFGAHDIKCPYQTDPETGKLVLERPMTGWAVMLDDDRIRLIQIVENDGNRSARWRGFAKTLLDEKPVSPRDRTTLRIEVSGEEVVVKLDGKRHRFSVPGLQPGFQGLLFSGTGYAELSGYTLETE